MGVGGAQIKQGRPISPKEERKPACPACLGSRAFIDERREKRERGRRERERGEAGPTNKAGVAFLVPGDECRWSALLQVTRPRWSFAFLAGRHSDRQTPTIRAKGQDSSALSLPFPSLPTAHSNLGSLHPSHIQFHSPPPAASNPDFILPSRIPSFRRGREGERERERGSCEERGGSVCSLVVVG
jgi:hypothetical protein